MPNAVSQVPFSLKSAAISAKRPSSSRKQYCARTSRIASFSSTAVGIHPSSVAVAWVGTIVRLSADGGQASGGGQRTPARHQSSRRSKRNERAWRSRQ